jgi:ABC-type transporter Mla subunit MlaD
MNTRRERFVAVLCITVAVAVWLLMLFVVAWAASLQP